MSRKKPIWKSKGRDVIEDKYYCNWCNKFHKIRSTIGKQHHYTGKRYLKKIRKRL